MSSNHLAHLLISSIVIFLKWLCAILTHFWSHIFGEILVTAGQISLAHRLMSIIEIFLSGFAFKKIRGFEVGFVGFIHLESDFW